MEFLSIYMDGVAEDFLKENGFIEKDNPEPDCLSIFEGDPDWIDILSADGHHYNRVYFAQFHEHNTLYGKRIPGGVVVTTAEDDDELDVIKSWFDGKGWENLEPCTWKAYEDEKTHTKSAYRGGTGYVYCLGVYTGAAS